VNSINTGQGESRLLNETFKAINIEAYRD